MSLSGAIRELARRCWESRQGCEVLTAVCTAAGLVPDQWQQPLPQECLLYARQTGDYNLEVQQEGGTQQWQVTNPLQPGDRVILLRQGGGQRFVVLDRLREGGQEG